MQQCEALLQSKLGAFFPQEILPRSRDLKDVEEGRGPLKSVDWDVKMLHKLRDMAVFASSVSNFQQRAVERVVIAIAKHCAKRQQQMPNFAALDSK